jgi:hypothetical protein
MKQTITGPLAQFGRGAQALAQKTNRLRNVLSACGVRFENRFVMFPIPIEPKMQFDGNALWHQIEVIKCEIDVTARGKVVLRCCEDKFGYKEGQVLNPAPLLIATEIWKMFVVPTIERNKQRNEIKRNGNK